ncbi:MAG: DUF3848 domain-containing protein [Oscillospiraceae bacterium]|nr:DUF3848 domain-containing protein [Oscillospiraceae bacterium]
MSDNTQTAYKVLAKKVYNEFENLKKTLNGLSANDIVDKSYEVAIKQIITEQICSYGYEHLTGFLDSEKDVLVLNSFKDPLSEIYSAWMNNELSIEEPLRETINRISLENYC